ncbi:MAG: AAA family ATPase [Bacteroidales bacterium]|nr:AAA family ATPase [Bacteroidales bacterium]
MLYPIGIQNFEDLRRNEYVYVDKTHHIHRLATTGKYYFLSRPRRFGKSLMMSTIEAYFKGKKELFKGLALEQLEKDWTEYPVLHLDLNGSKYMNSGDLNDILNLNLNRWESEYGVTTRYSTLSVRFQAVIDAAYEKTGRQVVILIDEYDKPIVDNLGNPELADDFKKTLQGFYSVLKAKDGQIRFGFLTGVSKIGKLSVFSGLNNLRDISMLPEYSDICGISEEDLHKYFDESVEELAVSNQLSKEDCYGKLKDMYDGYHFSEESVGMYNPFSLLNTFSSNKFKEYWFETGTPTLLVNVMKQTSFDVTTLSDQVEVSVEDLSGMQDIINRPIPLFFQTGYLTIKDYDKEFDIYTLGFPNDEVKNGFLKFIFSYYVPVNPAEGNTTTAKLAKALRTGSPDMFMRTLEALFANTTYQIQGDAEKNFQYAMYIIMELVGEYVQAERTTSNGRIDLLLQTKDYIYIVELKIDNTADAALQQIEDKGYAKPFVNDPRKLFKIGVSFSTADRRIEDWKVVE